MEDPLWRGLSVVDLAVQSQSYKFLETCCPQVLPTRMLYTQMHMYVYMRRAGCPQVLPTAA